MGSRAPHAASTTSTTVPPSAAVAEGRLYYMAGASDADNDRLIAYARGHLSESYPVMFAHRYSTRAAAGGGECQVELSEAEFVLRKRLGLFAMDWESAGHCYGIGMELNYWLATGLSVVVNGSHAHFEHALKGYPEMTLIWITEQLQERTPPPVPAARSVARRASGTLVPARASGYRMVHLSSNGSFQVAGEKLVEVLTGHDQ